MQPTRSTRRRRLRTGALVLALSGALVGGLAPHAQANRLAETKIDRDFLRDFCKLKDGFWIENPNGSFQCMLSDGVTISCPASGLGCKALSAPPPRVGGIKVAIDGKAQQPPQAPPSAATVEAGANAIVAAVSASGASRKAKK